MPPAQANCSIGGPRTPAPSVGLTDGGHINFDCSNCDKPLCRVWLTQPNKKRFDGKPFEWRVRATCPYCGDHSFIKTISGLYHPCGISKPHPDHPDDHDYDIAVTNIVDITEGADSEGRPIVIFKVGIAP